MSKNPQIGPRTKHIDTRYRFVNDMITERKLEVIHIRSEDNPSDIMTKNIRQIDFTRHSNTIHGGLMLDPWNTEDVEHITEHNRRFTEYNSQVTNDDDEEMTSSATNMTSADEEMTSPLETYMTSAEQPEATSSELQDGASSKEQREKNKWTTFNYRLAPLNDRCSMMQGRCSLSQASDTTKNKTNQDWTLVGKKGR